MLRYMLKSLWDKNCLKTIVMEDSDRHITGPQYFIIILQVNYMIRFLQIQCAQVCIQLSVC